MVDVPDRIQFSELASRVEVLEAANIDVVAIKVQMDLIKSLIKQVYDVVFPVELVP